MRAVRTNTNGVGAGGAQDGGHRVPRDHPGGRDHQDPGQDRQRDLPDQPGRQVDDGQQDQGMHNRGEPGLGPGTDVDRGPGDRARGRHAAEEPRGDRGQALPGELPVRAVGPGGLPSGPTMPAATRAESRDSMAASIAMDTAGISSPPSAAGSRDGHRRCRTGNAAGRRSGDVQLQQLGGHGGQQHRDQACGQGLVQLREQQHHGGDARDDAERLQHGGQGGLGGALDGGQQGVVARYPLGAGGQGTCWRKMIAAMPSVKPSTTGHGMKATARPSR